MALFNKFFSGRKKDSKANLTSEVAIESESWKPPVFNRDQVRVLLFREGDGRSRKLLFDSASVKKSAAPPPMPAVTSSTNLVQRLRRSPTPTAVVAPPTPERGKVEGYMEVTQDGVVYQYLRPQSDVKMLGEMVFGSVAMSFSGTTTKIHTLRSPPQLMMTKVFPAPQPKTDGEGAFGDSLSASVDCMPKRSHSERLSSSVGSADLVTSLEIPEWRARSCHEVECALGRPAPLRSTSSLSSLTSSSASADGFASSSLTHSGSYNSLQRRWLRCRTTSMEFGLPRRHEDSSFGQESGVSSQKRIKLGMSVLFTLGEQSPEEDRRFRTFFFSHITLIESHINKLRLAIESAYLNRKCFVKLVMEGYESLQRAICDLYTAPRLPDPVWLQMMSCHDHQHVICLKFITEFMKLVEQYDIKSTKFFVSTLLTAVLSHHLAWVPTVSPPGILPKHSYHEKHTAKWLHLLAKSHPYNPLWVQLGDLYGAVGFPCKTARTIVTGKKGELVRRFLYITSYFIRCSDVYENFESRLLENPRRRSFSAAEIGVKDIRKDSLSGGDEVFVKFECKSPDENTSESKSESCRKENEISRTLPSEDGDSVIARTLPSKDEGRLTPPQPSSGGAYGVCFLCSKSVNFGASPTSKDMVSLLRPGRLYCDACDELCRKNPNQKGARNGCIFDVSQPRTESGIVVDSASMCNSGEWLSSDGLKPDRDSGISGCGTEDPTLSKVSFTIGDIPLEEICYPQAEDSATEATPTLQRVSLMRNLKLMHHPLKGGRTQKLFVCPLNDTVSSEDGCVENSGISRTKSSLSRTMSFSKSLADCSTEIEATDDSLAKHGSVRCDSGIQSCEPSDLDMMALVDEKAMCPTLVAAALSHNSAPHHLSLFPPYGRPRPWWHCKGVGDGNLSTLKEGNLTTDFIGIPEEQFEKIVFQSTDCQKPANKLLQNAPPDYHKCVIGHPNPNGRTGSKCWRRASHPQCTHCLVKMLEKKVPDFTRADLFASSGKCRSSSAPGSGGGCSCGTQEKGVHCSSCRSLSEEDLSRTDLVAPKTRSRHWSEASLSQRLARMANNETSFVLMAKELPLPRSEVKQVGNSSMDYFRGFAWSLLASHADHYLADFALQGTNEVNFSSRLSVDLAVAVQNPILDERVAEAVCIIADTDNWCVQVASDKAGTGSASPGSGIPVGMSQLVANMAETLLHLWKLKMSPEFCLMHLEDRLQEIYFKSRLLAEYLLDKSSSNIEEVTSTLDLDASDLPLLLAVASTHSPPVTLMYGVPYR